MIPCELHDYIEIACTFRYPVCVTLKSGEVIEGIACDTQLDKQRRECMALSVNGAPRLVVLDELASLTAGLENPHFTTVSFN